MGLDTGEQHEERITLEIPEPKAASESAAAGAAAPAVTPTPDLTATVGVIPSSIGSTMPFSTVSPGALTKRHAMDVLDRVFHPGAENEKQAATEMNSTSCYQWARWFAQYHPTSPDKSFEDAERLLGALHLAITQLQTAVPEEIRTGVQNLKSIITAYGTEYYRLVQTNRTGEIAPLQQRTFGSPEFTSAVEVIGELKRFGQTIYEQLAEKTAREERKAYLQTEEGKSAASRYPQFARSYEVAPHKVETAQKNYEERLRQALLKHFAHTEEENLPLLQQQFPPEKIAEFISLKTGQLIHKAVESISSRLSDEETAKLYDNLPVTLTSMRKDEQTENVLVVFGTDRQIPGEYGPAFQLMITQALLKAKALELASTGNQGDNIYFLQHFGHAMKGHGVRFTQDQNAGIHLLHHTNGGKFDAETFYTPVSDKDPDFFADYLVLAQKNGNIEGLKRMFQAAMETSFSQGKTMMAYGQAAGLKIKFFRNLEHFSQKPKEDGQKQTPTYIQNTDEAIAALSDLQAKALCLLALKDRTLSQQVNELAEAQKKIEANLGEKLKIGHNAELATKAAKEETREAQDALKKERDEHLQFLREIRGKTGVMSRDIAAMIDAKLKDSEKPGKPHGT